MNTIKNTTSGKVFKVENDGTATLGLDSGKFLKFGGSRLYYFSSAITHNVTTTSAPSGSLAFTTNATGLGKWFHSDGSKWKSVTTTAAQPVPDVETADATDEASAVALANDLKDVVNELLANLRDAGKLAE